MQGMPTQHLMQHFNQHSLKRPCLNRIKPISYSGKPPPASLPIFLGLWRTAEQVQSLTQDVWKENLITLPY